MKTISLSVLVTGGAGYIGSHMVKMLIGFNHQVTVFDDLTRGYRNSVIDCELVEGDLRRPKDLNKLFARYRFDIVIHFAALAYVGESVTNPREYYDCNVSGTRNLLNAMLDTGVMNIVFSSSCAVYGLPKEIPISEKSNQLPFNPYGRTKLICEGMLNDYGIAYGLNSISLRYFNAAGCDKEARLGEHHDPETHLIPLLLLEALRIKRGGNPEDTKLKIFGDDYDTRDGSCIRDYIHVTDICSAHMQALERLFSKKSIGTEVYNLGNGNGYSVKEVIESCRRVTGEDIRYCIGARRRGDPPVLISSSDKAHDVLKWKPNYTKLDEIIGTAWHWFHDNR